MNERKLKSLFGRRVRSLRNLRDLTQQDLAERTNLSVEYISQVERGLASPSFKTITHLADALNSPVGALFDFSKLDQGNKGGNPPYRSH